MLDETVATPHLNIRTGNPDFLDLPWEVSVDDWVTDRVVEMPVGVHRHPVTFVAYDEGVFVIKEMPWELASSEYQVLLALEEVSTKTAEAVGLARREWLDPKEEQAGVIITRYVRHAFPYRNLLTGPGFGPRRDQMLDAVAGLLVELHIAGCYWGDCSLSNVLYRYDAGEIEAIMIDAETSELHVDLTDGQRNQDLEIMRMNLAGEMADIAAMSGVDLDAADLRLGEDICNRYEGLWKELYKDLIIAKDEGYKIRERIERLNDLGFSVHDVNIEPTDAGNIVRMTTHVGGRTFNSDRLRSTTGIDASENQARVILGDLNYYLAKEGFTTSSGKSVGTFKWLTNWFEPLTDRIAEIWYGDDPVQGYCDFLRHRMVLATERRRDVDNEEAFEDWITSGFPGFPARG